MERSSSLSHKTPRRFKARTIWTSKKSNQAYHMARKGYLISVRLDQNRSSDSRREGLKNLGTQQWVKTLATAVGGK